MSLQARMQEKLTSTFSPERLEVINESQKHAGHSRKDEHGEHEAFDGLGETHFRIRIVSGAFAGMSRIARHRAVNDAVADELRDGVHALAVEPSAPGEPVTW